jgi:DNA polymerase-3 subunit alpha
MAPKTTIGRNAPDLHVHSGHSIYDGLGSPKAVVDRAVELGWSAVCLTEHGHLASAAALYAAAQAARVKPIIGCELYVVPDDSLIDGDKSVMSDTRHLTVLALSYEGYQNLITWNDFAMQRPNFYGKPRISLEKMAEVAEHGLHHNVVLSGCLGGELCQCLLHANGNARQLGLMYLEAARDIFPNFYIEVQNQAIAKFDDESFTSYFQMNVNQRAANDHLLALAKELSIPVIVTNDSHYQNVQQRKPHMAMLARKQWRRSRDAHEAQTRDSTVSEFATQYVQYGAYMRSMESIAETLPDWARDQAIESIKEIVAEADVHLDPLDKFVYALPRSRSDDPIAEVRRRSRGRLKTMVERHGQVALDRFEYELSALKDFSHYLLIYADIIKMARSQGTYTWTRGSGIASLVLYCLGVHQIDPIHYDLLFERFVNPARVKFPDVDLDIEANRRDDVAKMVSDYMRELGQEVYAICTYSTLSNRNTFRLMAEAAGVDKERIDELAKLLPQMIDSGMVSSDEEAYEILREEYGLDLHSDASAIFDTIGGFSQHACAFVIGTEDRKLSDWVPTYRIASSDALVTQYNMKWIENMGFLKLDLLKLDTLSILHGVARRLGKDMDWIDSLGRSAPGVYDEPHPAAMKRLAEGRTDGIFTFQGGTQRRGCMEVKPETTQDLIAIQALYRPGATRTGNDKKFVARRRGAEEWKAPHELAAKRWNETYGIPIFQEQIMELAFDMGMTGEEVDDLYRAIKLAKGVGRGAAEAFEKFEPTFRKYTKGVMPEEAADAIWTEFDRMQGYSLVVQQSPRLLVCDPRQEERDRHGRLPA